jgi:hypothetical protein
MARCLITSTNLFTTFRDAVTDQSHWASTVRFWSIEFEEANRGVIERAGAQSPCARMRRLQTV